MLGCMPSSVIIAAPGDQSRIEDDMRMDSDMLAAGLRANGVEAIHLATVEEIVATVAANSMESDVIAVLSNGAFGGIHERLLSALSERFDSPKES